VEANIVLLAEVNFLDEDTDVWHGKGPRFTQDEKILPISKKG